jgi:hypothetical protein
MAAFNMFSKLKRRQTPPAVAAYAAVNPMSELLLRTFPCVALGPDLSSC